MVRPLGESKSLAWGCGLVWGWGFVEGGETRGLCLGAQGERIECVANLGLGCQLVGGWSGLRGQGPMVRLKIITCVRGRAEACKARMKLRLF